MSQDGQTYVFVLYDRHTSLFIVRFMC